MLRIRWSRSRTDFTITPEREVPEWWDRACDAAFDAFNKARDEAEVPTPTRS